MSIGVVYRCLSVLSIGQMLSARVVSLWVLSRARPAQSAAAFVGLPRSTHLRTRPREVAAGMNAGRFGAALSGQRSDISPSSFLQVLPTDERLDGQECPTPGAEPLSCAYHDFSCGVVSWSGDRYRRSKSRSPWPPGVETKKGSLI